MNHISVVLTCFICLVSFSLSYSSANPRIQQMVKLSMVKAQTAYDQGDFDSAITSFKEIIHNVPAFIPAYQGLGLAYNAKKDYANAIKYLKIAIGMNPDLAIAYETLGHIYYMTKQFDQAIETSKRALKIQPSLVRAKATLAWVYLLGKTDPIKAIPYFEQALAARDNPMMYYGLGMSYIMENKRPQVLEMITALKQRGQEKYANQLEVMMKDPRKIEVQTGTPLVEGGMQYDSDIHEVPEEGDGFTVRLRGYLPEE